MPRSVLLVCSSSGSVDRYSNQVSIFDVLEIIHFHDGADDDMVLQQGPSLPAVTMRITSIWERGEEELGTDFEHEISILLPDGERHVVSEGPFSFDKTRHRFIVDCGGFQPREQGHIRIVAKVRPFESQDWVSADYAIKIARVKRAKSVDDRDAAN